jgi:hypothetical protein
LSDCNLSSGWLRFGALVAITLEIEVIVALWLMGAFSPHP